MPLLRKQQGFQVCDGQSETSYFNVGKTFFSCWLTKALASCLPSRSTSRYSALILPLIFPSSVVKVELWEKCFREIKGNKDKCIQSQAQTGHQSGQCDIFGNREQNMGGATFLMSYNLFVYGKVYVNKPNLGILRLLKISLFMILSKMFKFMFFFVLFFSCRWSVETHKNRRAVCLQLQGGPA